jgi:hypothetical protein
VVAPLTGMGVRISFAAHLNFKTHFPKEGGFFDSVLFSGFISCSVNSKATFFVGSGGVIVKASLLKVVFWEMKTFGERVLFAVGEPISTNSCWKARRLHPDFAGSRIGRRPGDDGKA